MINKYKKVKEWKIKNIVHKIEYEWVVNLNNTLKIR